jgi:hypothetical protein
MATSPFVPEDERPEYVKPEFLSKVAGLEPLEWLPKIQAKQFRLDDEIFDTNTPKVAQEKLRGAAPAGTTVELYRNREEFKAAFQEGQNLKWIQGKLALSESGAHTGAPSSQAPH